MATLLEVRGLKTQFETGAGTVKAVDGITYDVAPGETVAIVGESGSGKSVGALSILRLIPNPPGKITDGEILFDGQNLLNLSEDDIREIRGNDISMVFQEPMTSLNPVLTIGMQLSETMMLHMGITRAAADKRAEELLGMVGISEPGRRLRQFPHHLSGGMRQRVMIALALSCEPRLIIADEPTTALDVTIQAQILNLMLELKERLGTAIILITHDLGVVAETAQQVVVMYAGRKVEQTSVEQLFERPLHPYTRGLLRSIPSANKRIVGDAQTELHEIEGVVPTLRDPIAGCAFVDRCELAQEQCHQSYPPFEEKRDRHFAACWRSNELLNEPGIGQRDA